MIEILSMLGTFIVATLLPAVVIFAVGVLLIRMVMKLLTKLLEKSKLESIAYNLILKVVQVVAYLLLGLIVASHLGIDVSGIVALASVLSLAVSLSVQDLLTNTISGITLLYTKPFTSGDFVEIAGQSGTVKEIGLTYTTLNTPDNKVVSIPNGSVTSAQIVNYTVTGKRRVEFTICVSYEAAPAAVIAALKKAAQVPTALEDPAPFAALRNYSEGTVEYILHVWSSTENYWPTLFAVNENIKAVFEAEGVKMSFPHMNVHLDK